MAVTKGTGAAFLTYEGPGSPVGQLAAPVGAVYTDSTSGLMYISAPAGWVQIGNPAPVSGPLITAGQTGSVTGTLVVPAAYGHLTLTLNVTALGVTSSVQVTVNATTASGYTYPVLVGLAVSSIGSTPYRIGPGLTPSANAVANDNLSPTNQVICTIVGTATYGVDYSLSI